ncbi:MAG: T9SS type A sorting domain-containing protein [Candidatus Coatesbacteria bacterium]|nr:T9SS type A sorting domain-containing protein [Candidatus Coatesbacteria bacterium]
MKEAIATKGPVFAMMKFFNDFQYYKGGIYECNENSGYLGLISVCLIGYDNYSNCWIGKNSWGTEWGEKGYFRCRIGGADSLGNLGQTFVEIADVTNHLWYMTPLPARYYVSGKKTNIEWHSLGVNKINIYLSTDGGTSSSWTEIVKDMDASSQTYEWIIPEVESSQCKIKIIDSEHTREGSKCSIGAAKTDGVFGIGKERSVRLIYPKGGETFYNSHRYYIYWDCTKNVSKVNIYGSTDDGSTWLEEKVISNGEAQKKSFLWTVDTRKFPPTTKGRMKITDTEYEIDVNDINDDIFTVSDEIIGFNDTKHNKHLPEELSLTADPNPCRNRLLNIRFSLPKNTCISIKIINLIGKTVTIILDKENYGKGNYIIHWLPINLASGIYFIEMKSEQRILNKSFLFVK